ncbi:MAG: hypothetical protein WAR37_03305 [Candidatus Microsaccharimonas sp.]
MIHIIPFESEHTAVPSFDATEFCLPTVSLEDLATGMGRYGIFKAIIDHQSTRGFLPENQAWAGINGISLFKRRSLFSILNPLADPDKLNANFNATQLEHWKSVIGEVKYSPFTYIHKAFLQGQNYYPTIVGFDINKLEPLHQNDDENIDWKPGENETVETALKSVYYFTGLFPRE